MRYVQLALHCFTWHLISDGFGYPKTRNPGENGKTGLLFNPNSKNGTHEREFWFFLYPKHGREKPTFLVPDLTPEKWYPSRTRHLLPEPITSFDDLHLFYSQNYYNNDIVKMFFCHKEKDNMLWLRPLLAFLMAFRIGLTTPQEQQSDCQFPSRWKGTWYHSGFPHPLNISANHISSKGTCVQHQESMFIMVDR